MAYAQFISTDYLSKWSIIPDNVDKQLVSKFIRQAQDINIKSVLGNDLHNALMNKLINNNLDGDYAKLMNEYIMPAQTEWTVYHALPFIHQRITNQSVVKSGTDNSQPVDLKELQALREEVRNTAEYYSQRIYEYIINNHGSFPEYFTTNGVSSIKPTQNNYSSGIYLGKSLGNNYPTGIRIDYGNTGTC